MKKCLVLFLLFFSSLSLFAQNLREARIFVPPVIGSGGQGDASFFYKQLTYEVVLQYYSLVRTKAGSDFELKGTIELVSEREDLPLEEITRVLEEDSEDEESEGRPGQYIFTIELIYNPTGETIGEQYVIYNNTNTYVTNLVSVIVYNLLSIIPYMEQLDDWRSYWLFVGLSGMWAPRVYIGEEQSLNWTNFGLLLQAEYSFFSFLSASLEVQFVRDWVIVSQADKEEYNDFLMEIPISLRYIIKPLDYLMLEPYTGVSINVSLMGLTQPSILSWLIGFQYGVKVGPGVLTIDPRISVDLFNSVVQDTPYRRNLIQITAGYKYGFFKKKIKGKE